MRVVITNCQLYNSGDAAIVLGMFRILQKAFGDDIQITILTTDAIGARKYYAGLYVGQSVYFTFRERGGVLGRLLAKSSISLHRARLRYFRALLTAAERRAREVYRCADLVISVGGTYLVEHYDLRARLYEFYMALLAGRPPVLFTQSLGPFRRPENRKALQEILAASPLILLRDERSKRNLEELGIEPTKMHVHADAAFALVDSSRVAAARSARREIRRVAISVRAWQNFEQRNSTDGMRIYRSAMARAVEWLVNVQGAEVVFVSTCQGIPEYWADDSAVAGEIVSSLAPDVRQSVKLERGFHSPKQLLEMLTGFDMAIATRMHMAILALASGVPVLPIAYEFKTEELFSSRLNLGEWVLSLDTLEETSVVALLPQFVAALPEIRPSLFDAVAREKESALDAASVLRGAYPTLVRNGSSRG